MILNDSNVSTSGDIFSESLSSPECVQILYASIQQARAQPEIFQGREGLVRLRHFYKHFVKNTRKKCSAGEDLGVFFS